ncbi:MAG: amidase [Sphingomonas bacterium]|uniref:amidase family protein n=1 Tax=Sphingomonas bacterium TaxID=1895847 RepID=UPI002628D6D0|nr:amidase family protein [Sphingomonas bacterium]MDB5695197.1 amidase [Sphingomonas bacterium]
MSERSALATAAAIRAGETTALAETDAAIARIEARNSAINAVVVRDFDRARATARAFDQSGDKTLPFAGVPMTVKESFDVAGLPTTFGFEEHRDYQPAQDAAAVQRLKAAGAIILGKTNVPVSLADLQSVNPVYGRTNHPLDAALTCGGSSGGSAAALASGMVPLEIGSDIGGSIRVPAHFCGVWGHKSTYGTLSIEGQMLPGTDGAPIAMSVTGPMARDGADLAAALDVLSDIPLPRARHRAPGDLRLLTITSHPLAPVDPAIATAVAQVGEAFARAGATVDTHSALLPDQTAQFANYMRLLAVTLARGAPAEDGSVASLPDWLAMLDDQARTARAWARLFERYDAVIAPVLGTTAYPHSDATIRNRRLTIDGAETEFGYQFAFPGLATYPMLPATAVPITTSDRGLPIGVQIITASHRDHDAIAIARQAWELTR